MDDLSYYAIAFLCACDKHLTTYETLGHWLCNLLQYDDSWDVFLKFRNGSSRACSWSENSHNGCSIRVTTPQVDFRV